jgi:acyl dehydratase
MAQEATEKKEPRYELVEIPEEFGPVQMLVDDHRIKTYAFTQDDYRSWYFSDNSPFNRRIGHASILTNDLLWLFLTSRENIVGLHAQEELWFHNPVFAGEQATLQGKYVDKYEKRGKGYVVMEAEARGEDGRLLVRRRGIEIMRSDLGPVVGRRTAKDVDKQVTAEYRKEVVPAEQARADLKPGTSIAPLVKHVTQEQMSIFSKAGEYSKNFHTDLDRAREAGLRLPVAQGQQLVGYLTEMLTNFFGATWFTSGWEKLKFIHPVYAGETVTAHGIVTGMVEENEGARLELEIWVENGDGVKATVGWASAVVDG